MRVVRNAKYINGRKRASRIMVSLGLVSLGASIVMTFQPELILPAYGVLIFGFIFFNAGMQQLAKWNRSPRPDQALDHLLRRLNDRYTMIHYPNLQGVRPEHVLVYPGGLVVITTREIAGRVVVDGDRWRRLGSRLFAFLFMGGPQLGNPTRECLAEQAALHAFLEAQSLPGGDLIDGLIVFLNPRAELEVVSSDLTVVTGDELLDAIRDLGTEAHLTSKQREEIVAALSQGEGVEGPSSLPSRESGGRRTRAAY